MDRKQLKEAGKSLFKKNYWYSVAVTLLMLFSGGPTIKFSTEQNSGKTFSFDDILNASNLEYFLKELLENVLSLTVIVASLIGLVLSLVLYHLVFASLRCGGIRYFLKSRKNQPAYISEVAENLRDKTNFNIAKVTFFKNLKIFIGFLLFIIPGIVNIYEYWAVDYILAVRPDIDKKEAFRLSTTIMKGNKLDLFVLQISFLGWYLLSSFTAGLLNIFYVNPYVQATQIEFFSQIRSDAIAKGVITPNDIPDYEVYNPFYQSPYDQPQNSFYAPEYNTTEGNFSTPQKPVQPSEPVELTEPVQPIEPVIEDNNDIV